LNLNISKNNKGIDDNKENKIKEIQTQMEVIQEQIDLERRKRSLFLKITNILESIHLFENPFILFKNNK